MSRPSTPFFFFAPLISVLLLFSGIYLGFEPFRVMFLLISAPKWPSVEGQVISSHIEERNGGFGSGNIKGYVTRVWFSYALGPDRFVSKSLTLIDKIYPLRVEAEAVVDRYPAHKQVAVRYSDNDPAQVYIETSKVPLPGVLKAGASVFIVLCAFMSLFDNLSRRDRQT